MKVQRRQEERCLRDLVDHMFQDVFTVAERDELRVLIEAWEADNPGCSAHVRITAWIDLAYRYQVERAPQPELGAVRLLPMWA